MTKPHRLRASSWACTLTLTATLGVLPLAANGQSLEVIATGLNQPMVVTSPSADGILYVAEKGGVIRTVDRVNGTSTVFLDLSNKVGSSGERGLLGLAFDPQFASNGRVYVNYSDAGTGHTVIERYTTLGGNPRVGDAASAYRLMTIEQPAGETSHKAGWIGFRPGEPNNLYVTTGDGAWHPAIADPYGNGQNLNSNLGKVLRIDVNRDDFAADTTRNYGIPVGNMSSGNAEIWAYGLRNPFRGSFDRLTGDLWLGDVGFSTSDEVDFLSAGTSAGTNFGWSLREGSTGAAVLGAVDPIFERAVGGGSALIGGYVYRGPDSGLYGSYVFADFVQGGLYSLRYDGSSVTDLHDWTNQWLNGLGSAMISSFGEDADGNLYLTDLAGGRVFALASTVPEPATALLWWAGLGLLGGMARRRGRHSFRPRRDHGKL